jgi:pimeloyl-ACP methyl ester carboxylesterase
MSTKTLDIPAGVPHFEAGIDFLASGAAPEVAQSVFVLLHGIGSGAASWHYQLAAVSGRQDIYMLAWNAPGYATSSSLNNPTPNASDYAKALWAWLDSLRIQRPITLVGHSLGTLIAASAALMRPTSIQRLVLLSPALGYGDESIQEQLKIVTQRMANLQNLGAQGMAAARAPAMLSDNAEKDHIKFIENVMGQLNSVGYEQAVRMLSTGRLIADLKTLVELQTNQTSIPIDVACGSADAITPPQKCLLAANAAKTALIDLGPVGHVCALEGHSAVNHLLGIV